jgi:hypothetical protein
MPDPISDVPQEAANEFSSPESRLPQLPDPVLTEMVDEVFVFEDANTLPMPKPRGYAVRADS